MEQTRMKKKFFKPVYKLADFYKRFF